MTNWFFYFIQIEFQYWRCNFIDFWNWNHSKKNGVWITHDSNIVSPQYVCIFSVYIKWNGHVPHRIPQLYLYIVCLYGPPFPSTTHTHKTYLDIHTRWLLPEIFWLKQKKRKENLVTIGHYQLTLHTHEHEARTIIN